MPYSKDISDFQRWIDGILNTDVRVVSCHDKPIKLVFEGEKIKKTVSPFEIQSVLSNRKKNAFTVVWTDGTHTTVHCQSGDKWDDEKALAMCFTKKALGNKGNFNDKFNDALNNKMKVIHTPESAKETVLAGPCHYTNAPEKACDCDGACIECKCKGETFADTVERLQTACAKTEDLKNSFGVSEQTATKLGKAANKANVALRDMIEALTTEPVKVQRYNLFLMEPNGDATEIYHQGTDEEIHKAMRAYRTKHYPILEANRTPYRIWQRNGSLIVDFGAGSYFKVPGMDHDTFVKGK